MKRGKGSTASNRRGRKEGGDNEHPKTFVYFYAFPGAGRGKGQGPCCSWRRKRGEHPLWSSLKEKNRGDKVIQKKKDKGNVARVH